MNIRIPYIAANFLISWETTGLSRRTLLGGVTEFALCDAGQGSKFFCDRHSEVWLMDNQTARRQIPEKLDLLFTVLRNWNLNLTFNFLLSFMVITCRNEQSFLKVRNTSRPSRKFNLKPLLTKHMRGIWIYCLHKQQVIDPLMEQYRAQVL